MTSILTCKLKFEIDNWKFGKKLEIWEKMEILKRFGNWDKFWYYEKINWKNVIFGGKMVYNVGIWGKIGKSGEKLEIFRLSGKKLGIWKKIGNLKT